jgi:selenide,water dikinase
MAPEALAQVLRPLADLFPAECFPQLQVGLGTLSDDAAVYRVRDDLALIATVDFFTPIVDDPYTFGAIAAANALSDVYAMNGQPALALNIACLSECLPPEVIAEVLRGGAEKVLEAGAVLAGGHSVDDREPKYGLVALGFAHPDQVWTKSGAQVGDVLVLTKPLGVGMITTVAKADEAEEAHVEAAVASMLQLNRAAAELLRQRTVHACTDVTGFALLGHASEMAEKSGVQLQFRAGALPLLPGVAEYAETWMFPAGTGRNRACFGPKVEFAADVSEEMQHLLLTPETSGGLLAALPAGEVAAARQAFAAAGAGFWEVGTVVACSSDAGPLVRVKG